MCREARKGRTKPGGSGVKKVLRLLERLQLYGGNAEDERAAAASTRLEAKCAGLRFSQTTRNREAEACAGNVGRRIGGTVEWLKNALALGLRNAGPAIRN